MKFLKFFFNERCPKCNKVLDTTRSNSFYATVIKHCPDNHYQKEYHPALETFIETDKVS